jgi:hypothetical protein
MSAAVQVIETETENALGPAFVERAREYVRCGKAESTQRAYASDWADFESWCGERGFPFLRLSR